MENFDSLIEKYLKEELSAEEKQIFENSVQTNTALRDRLIYRKGIIEGIKLAAQNELKTQIEKNTFQKKSIDNKIWKLVALTMFAFAVLGWWFVAENPIRNTITNTITKTIVDTLKIKPHTPVFSVYPIQKTVDVKKQKTDTIALTAKDSSIKTSSDTSSSALKDEKKSTDKNNFNKNTSSESPISSAPQEEFVIRKDELLFTKEVNLIEKSPASSSSTLALSTAEKLNPEAGLPEENSKPNKNFQIEFWKSPINYKGYKMARNKIILFGIEEPDGVKLYKLDENIYLEYEQNIYKLESTYDFQSFLKIKDVVILSQLK